jgi:Tol biopolymer transport system component
VAAPERSSPAFSRGGGVGIVLTAVLTAMLGCQPTLGPTGSRPAAGLSPTPGPSPTSVPVATRIEHVGYAPVLVGTAIKLADLSGRIVFDDFEDVFAMDVDGSNVARVADSTAGPEFDGAWSADGRWIVYRDSTRGINEDDEIFIARADGSQRRNLTNDPANDWGPDWSSDGTTITFNSTRDGEMHGFLINPDGTNLRRIDVDAWVEYPSFSPDGSKIAYMGALGANYELFIAELKTGEVHRLTDSPGHDGWPAWSPDGATIAFSSVRDDCRFAERSQECWRSGDIGEHFDIWLIDADGTNLRRVTTEFGQFVAWSPDSRYLLVSGGALYVIRPDGTGRLELRAVGIPHALGGIPDWR